MARGPKPINWKEVEFAMMCSENQAEIAASQGVCTRTLQTRFEEEYGIDYLVYCAQLHKKGDILLREAQMKTALKGNSNMQMFLGRVRLGQKEAEESKGNTVYVNFPGNSAAYTDGQVSAEAISEKDTKRAK
jgi:hypothetical protein